LAVPVLVIATIGMNEARNVKKRVTLETFFVITYVIIGLSSRMCMSFLSFV
jgi:hypothetical protein